MISSVLVSCNMNYNPSENITGNISKDSVANQNAVNQTNAQNQIQNCGIIEKSAPIVAVNSDETKGYVGNVTVRLISGNSHVLIATNPFSQADLQNSANIAIDVAKKRSGLISPKVDFIVTFNINASVIGGESAGAASAIAAIAALENKQMNSSVAVTGTINEDGSVGQVGGILEKAKAVADAGYKKFLVPSGQSKVRTYERTIQNRTIGGIDVSYVSYSPKTIDIREDANNWGLEIIEVSNIQDVEKYVMLPD